MQYSLNDIRYVSSRMDLINYYKIRAWNYFIIDTPTHWISVINTNLHVLCTNTLVIFDKSDIEGTKYRVESVECSDFELAKISAKGNSKSDELTTEFEIE